MVQRYRRHPCYGLPPGEVAAALRNGVLCIYIVLVLLFKRLLHPVTIFFLPFSLGRAYAGLLVADKRFSMPSVVRLITMTTLAMGAGMLRIAIGRGPADTRVRAPVAVAVIGGLITSTFLSLLIIPAVFT